jgi:ABC-type amino acid transport substrate-binding protein
MAFRYWDWGATPKRDDYQFALLTLALDKTVKDYGPYQLTRVVRSYSTSRLRREINRGDVVNVHAGPWRPLETREDKLPERSLRVNVPIFGDLLGYRKLLIRRADLARFKAIRQVDDLKRLVVGQANGWVDVEIYRHNGYRVNDIANPATLFDMLARKRIDYIPISLMDAETTLASRPELAAQLMLLPDITLYFPLPVIFYVNIHEPRMAERLEAGLKQARQDGSFERLFRASFADEIQLVRDGSVRQFMLVNPFAPKDLAMTRLLEPIAPANSPSAPPRFKAGRLGVEAGLDPPRQWGGQVWTGRASR